MFVYKSEIENIKRTLKNDVSMSNSFTKHKLIFYMNKLLAQGLID